MISVVEPHYTAAEFNISLESKRASLSVLTDSVLCLGGSAGTETSIIEQDRQPIRCARVYNRLRVVCGKDSVFEVDSSVLPSSRKAPKASKEGMMGG